ncbi:MAG TPA: type II toxin-antitoxin system RelE/ParE family toxin [Thermoanaerobaculia bacterium]|jgi:plasmid stabilization system protein ParE|nr:type II toxin-antitoxin system RelE/ParE family toxin [Thermoanaerobaculia bacterium]
MKYIFLAPARTELQEAVYYYEDRRPGLGEEFAAEVKSTIGRILLNPTVWTRISKNVRRCRLRRFPYALIYQARRDAIVVVAVAHLRRDPDYWRSRLDL